MKLPHTPVLQAEVVQVLAPQAGQVYLDGTAGYGGHAAAVLEHLGPDGRLILVDRDATAIQALTARFGDRAEILHTDYLTAAQRLPAEGTFVDMILLDLGVSSPQFDNKERGFSFGGGGPLDMRMDQSQALTAAEVVNEWPQRELELVIRDYGEEPRARAVARSIVQARPLHSTAELAVAVRRVAAGSAGLDAATRTFQAIRIAVNAELELLEAALPVMVRLLAPGGRLAVISFHSLEDRMVKQFFDREAKDCICPPKQPICTCGHAASVRKLTVKPIMATADELASNPRARSAKLRAAEKINKNKRRTDDSSYQEPVAAP